MKAFPTRSLVEVLSMSYSDSVSRVCHGDRECGRPRSGQQHFRKKLSPRGAQNAPLPEAESENQQLQGRCWHFV